MAETEMRRADHGSDQSDHPTLDIDHLNRMTLGDRELAREVLQLFDRQAAMLAERLRSASASVAAACAHTLKGAARGIGAWRLADAATQVERVVAAGAPETSAVIERLVGAVDETRHAINRHLGPD